MPYAQEMLRAIAGWSHMQKVCQSVGSHSVNLTFCPSQQKQVKSQAVRLSDWLSPYRIHSRLFSLGADSAITAREDSEGKQGPRNLILAVDRSKACITFVEVVRACGSWAVSCRTVLFG